MVNGTDWIAALLLAAVTTAAGAADLETTGIPPAEIDGLEAHCLKTSNLPHHIGSSCSERLGRHVASVPIWYGATAHYTDGGRGSLHWSLLSDRNYLGFTRADLLLDDLPVWSDIFDGGIEQRIDVAARVFQDPVCAALQDVGGIQVALNERCEARDLFKYAAYLDGCVTGLDRVRHFHGPMAQDGTSLYDRATEASSVALDVWPLPENWENAPSLAEMGYLAPSLAESSLMAMWVADQCRAMPSRMFDGDLRLIDRPDGPTDLRAIAAAHKPVHDAAIAIAARAGDPWAAQMYYVRGTGLVHDVEYWTSLSEFNPLLFHRWMTTHVGTAMRLDPREKSLHAFKAYTIMRRTWPELTVEDHFRLHYDVAIELIDPSWRDGSVLPDASELEELLVYPSDAATR